MKLPSWNWVQIQDAGHTVRSDAANAVQIETESFPGGHACYLSAKAPEGGFSDVDSIVFSPDQSDCTSFSAIMNHSTYWSSPVWGKNLSELPERIQEVLIKTETGFRCYLPVCTGDFRVLLKGTPNGMAITLSSNKTGITSIDRSLVYICMEGTQPLRLLKEIAKEAAKRMGNGLKLRSERTVPKIFDSFGWCSWDAFQIRINHRGLIEKAKEFSEKKIPVSFAILDDMWADVPPLNDVPEDATFKEICKAMHSSSLHSFQGDPKRFPEGMEKAVSDLKANGIPHVGIWFPTSGYWRGWDPAGEEAKMPGLFVTTEDNRIVPKPEYASAVEYFRLLCSRAKSWGADLIKIDNQAFYFQYHNLASFGECAKAIQPAIEKNAKEIFNGNIINCMGMATECLFNRTETAICRCSDDFIPESPEWFAKNILQCSFNGLLQGQFQVNDWDMWWTDDAQAQKNSLCRAISGGPIYVSDKLGRTKGEVLHPLMLSDGSILRPDESATPTADCLMENPTEGNRPFKIRNNVGKAGLVAAFHIANEAEAVLGTVSPCDTENEALMQAGKEKRPIAWYEYFSGTAGTVSYDESLPLTLNGKNEMRLYTFVPISAEKQYAVLGRTDLFIGVKAVEENENGFLPKEAGKVALISQKNLSLKDANGKVLHPILQKDALWVFDCPAQKITVDCK